MTALAAIALWLHPVLLAALALRIAAGEADALWLVLGALIAPLVALLAPSRRAPERGGPAGIATGVVLTVLLAANLLVAGDAAALFGGAPWQGIVFAAVVALLVVAWPDTARAGAPALALGMVALLLPLGAVAVGAGSAPSSAWTRAASRPALTFSERGPWSRGGERFALGARLSFGDGQRVTAVAHGTFRVIEHDTPKPTVREWRLAAGETLTLRPGDELVVPSGARLGFEAGRRIPGAPASGADWADAPTRGPEMLPAALGALVTFLGAALALVPPAPRGACAAVAGPLALLVALTGAVGWGVYTAAIAPELALGGSPLAPLLRLPALVMATRGRLLALLALLALGFILFAVAAAARARLATVAAPAYARTVGSDRGRRRRAGAGALRPVVAAHGRPGPGRISARPHAPGLESHRRPGRQRRGRCGLRCAMPPAGAGAGGAGLVRGVRPPSGADGGAPWPPCCPVARHLPQAAFARPR
jgi:hypothetical protein